MSARRAAIRRERLQRNKIEKKKGKLGSLERAKEQGIIDCKGKMIYNIA